MSSLDYITLDRKTGDGKYGDVLDVAEVLARDCGSATNAIAVMVRQSPLYLSVKEQLKEQLSKDKPASGS